MFIYKITNLINQKVYVGLDTGPESEMRRWRSHRASYQKHSGKSKLYNAMVKYGIENFVCEIIDHAENAKELRDREEFWITKFDACKNGLNILPSANGGWTLDDLSEESKERKMQGCRSGAVNVNRKKWKTGNEAEIHQNLQHAKSLHTYFKPGEKSKIVKQNWELLSEEERFQKSNGLREFWKTLSEEEKSKRGKTGSLKALETNAKRYFVYDPLGNEYFVIGLGIFCKEKNLGEKSMYFLKRVAKGHIIDFNGWKCLEVDKNTGEKIIPSPKVKQKPGPKKKYD